MLTNYLSYFPRPNSRYEQVSHGMTPLFHLRPLLALILVFFIVDLPLGHTKTIDELKAGVVKITSTAAGQQRVGTGFIVKINNKTAYIVTASHVVEGASLIVNFFTDPDRGYKGTTRNMQGDNPKGLAVITVQGSLPEGIRALLLAPNFEVKGGESATVIGFRRSPSIQWGVLQGILTGQTGGDLMVSGAVANEGNSGGPILVNDKVVGVMTEVFDDIGYAVPASITQIILKGWGVRVEPTIRPPDRVVPSDAKKSEGKKKDLTQAITAQDGASMVLVPANESPSTDIDHPRWLRANTIRGEGVGEYVSYYYTFLADPGEIKVIADGKNGFGGVSNALRVVLMDLDAKELLEVSVGNTKTDKRVVKRVKLHHAQQILMRVLLDKVTIDYQVRLEGAVKLGPAPTPNTEQPSHQVIIDTNESPSTDIDHPRWLHANTIRGKGVDEHVSYYYTFLADPGEIKVIADGKNRSGGSTNALGVVLMDLDANELLKVRLGNTRVDKRVVKRMKIHQAQQILMRVLVNKRTIDYQVRLEGAVKLGPAPTPSTAKTNHQAMIVTDESSSTNIDNPTWLSANVIRGEGVGKDVSYYYTFLADPGEIKVIADGKNGFGGVSNALRVVLMDLDAKELLEVSVGNTKTDKRVVKRVKLHHAQQILMRVLLDKVTIDYQVRLEGAVNLEAAPTPKE